MTVVAALIVVAVVVAATPQRLADTLTYEVCRVVTLGQGACTPPPSSAEDHKPTEPCVTGQENYDADSKVSIVVVTLKNGKHLMVQTLSDGTYKVTVSDSAGVGVEAGVGGGVTLTVMDTPVGGAANAGVGASIDMTGGNVYYAKDKGDLNHLMGLIAQDEVKDAVGGTIPAVGGLLGWVSDKVGLTHPLPDADEVYAEGGFSVDASAEVTGAATHGGAGISAAGVLGVRTKKDGTVTYYIKNHVEGEAGISSLVGDPKTGLPTMQGEGISGSADLVNAVTFDADGNMINIQSTAVASGSGSGYVATLFGGDADGSLYNTAGKATIFQATLPIDGNVDQSVGYQYLAKLGVASIGPWTNPVVGVTGAAYEADFFSTALAQGTVTQQDFDTDSTTIVGVNASGKLGIELGVDANISTASMDSTGAKYWDGSRWVEWQGCS